MPFSNRNYTIIRSKEAVSENATFMSRVYLWMTAGVLISGLTAYSVSLNMDMVLRIAQNKGIFFGLIIFQLIAVVALSAMVQRMSVWMASAVYAIYATLVGLTFSVLFLEYTLGSLSLAFFSTAFSFAGLSAFGFLTKRDLGPVGSFCMIGLFGVIGVMLLGFLIPSMMTGPMQLTISSLCILVFAGLTAYDTQRIKAMQYQFTSVDQARKGAIYGALTLYLDFINLFLSILRLMGDRR
jgi:FtsH-binding integral membrane protein